MAPVILAVAVFAYRAIAHQLAHCSIGARLTAAVHVSTIAARGEVEVRREAALAG